ncbi:MAG: hypothetical protein ACRD6X_00565 [Pyrinomonadaceae bacterium]
MVTETVVKEALSKDLIDAGNRLTRLLDENRFDATASFWFFIVDSGVWRLIIASPNVDSDGIKGAYKKIQEILSKPPHGDGSIHLKDITLLSPSDPLISLMKIGMRTGNGISGIRFSKNLINGVLIEDAYIYRLT